MCGYMTCCANDSFLQTYGICTVRSRLARRLMLLEPTVAYVVQIFHPQDGTVGKTTNNYDFAGW